MTAPDSSSTAFRTAIRGETRSGSNPAKARSPTAPAPGPETRTTEMAPGPKGVATAAMVSIGEIPQSSGPVMAVSAPEESWRLPSTPPRPRYSQQINRLM